MEKHNMRSLAERYQANCDRIQEMAAAIESENRERTEAEEREYLALRRENEVIAMKASAANAPTHREKDINRQLRENVLSGKPGKIVLAREIQTSAALADTGIIPVQEEEMLKPLRAGLIYEKVGVKVCTGLVAGKLRWAKHGKAVAQFANEGEKLADSKINFSKLDTKPVRLGIAVPVTREELESSQGIVESVIREEMPAAIVDAVNEAMFTTSKTYTGADSQQHNRSVYGPFAGRTATNLAGAVPTRNELLKAKAAIASSGIQLTAPCWVMTEAMKAELEDIKVDSGSGRFLCEDDKVLGWPVFTTPYIGEGYIGLGDWSCQAAGFFGDMSLVVDPYTLARNNATDFVLNAHFATETLYDEAFVLLKAKANA